MLTFKVNIYIFFLNYRRGTSKLKKRKTSLASTMYGILQLNPTQLITYNSMKKLMERFTFIAYNISFILTCLLHSGRHSTLYMNAGVNQ